MARAGVPTSWLPRLAGLRALGAVGLVIGLGAPPLATAAAVGVILYFVGAIITHLRAHWYSIGYPASLPPTGRRFARARIGIVSAVAKSSRPHQPSKGEMSR